MTATDATNKKSTHRPDARRQRGLKIPDAHVMRGAYNPCLMSRTTRSSALSKRSSDDLPYPYPLVSPKLFLTAYGSDDVSGDEIGG